MEWLEQVQFWYWLIAAIIMIILEMVIPAAYFLWMGISAFIMGLILYFIPTTPFLIQIVVFGVLSVVTLLFYKKTPEGQPDKKDEPNLNRRGEQFIGRIFTLEEPIVNGVGKVKADDSIWKVKGIDMPAGTRVRVLSVEGTILNVKEEAADTES